MLFPTYIIDLDIEILLYFSDKDLVNLNLTNKYLNELLNKESFWDRRLKINQYPRKPPNCRYKEWYMHCRGYSLAQNELVNYIILCVVFGLIFSPIILIPWLVSK